MEKLERSVFERPIGNTSNTTLSIELIECYKCVVVSSEEPLPSLESIKLYLERSGGELLLLDFNRFNEYITYITYK